MLVPSTDKCGYKEIHALFSLNKKSPHYLLFSVIDESDTEMRRTERISELPYHKDYERLGFGLTNGLSALSKHRTEAFRLSMVNCGHGLCSRLVYSSRKHFFLILLIPEYLKRNFWIFDIVTCNIFY